jgi:uncharacterized protein YccT (UPF0319 family)
MVGIFLWKVILIQVVSKKGIKIKMKKDVLSPKTLKKERNNEGEVKD